jgi:hypothetical protein
VKLAIESGFSPPASAVESTLWYKWAERKQLVTPSQGATTICQLRVAPTCNGWPVLIETIPDPAAVKVSV